MKRGLTCIALVLVLSLSMISAFSFGDIFNKITGHATALSRAECVDNYCTGSNKIVFPLMNGAGMFTDYPYKCEGNYWVDSRGTNWKSSCATGWIKMTCDELINSGVAIIGMDVKSCPAEFSSTTQKEFSCTQGSCRGYNSKIADFSNNEDYCCDGSWSINRTSQTALCCNPGVFLGSVSNANCDSSKWYKCGVDVVEVKCTDSDGGRNYYKKGFFENSQGSGGSDACYSSKTLLEGYCDASCKYGLCTVNYNCPYGCKDGACLEKSSETTTTCTDSDGGKNYEVKGVVQFNESGIMMPYEDSCLNGELFEFSCVDGWLNRQVYTCPNGCKDGSCVGGEETTCTDSDGGLNYWVKGKIYVNGEYHNEDKCTSPYDGSLNEWYCDGGMQNVKNYKCLYGCLDGACVQGQPKVSEVSFTPASPVDSLERISSVGVGEPFALYGVINYGPDTHYVEYILPDNCVFENTEPSYGIGGNFVVGSNIRKVFVDSPNHNFGYHSFKCIKEGYYNFAIKLINSNNNILDTLNGGIKITNKSNICTDSDSGKNYWVKGKVSEGNETPVIDKCTFGSDLANLMEYSCENGIKKSTPYKCSNGCQDGACIVGDGDSRPLREGESAWFVGNHSVSINYIDSTRVKFNVNGEITNLLQERQTQKLSDGYYIGVDFVYVETSEDYEGGRRGVQFWMGKNLGGDFDSNLYTLLEGETIIAKGHEITIRGIGWTDDNLEVVLEVDGRYGQENLKEGNSLKLPNGDYLIIKEIGPKVYTNELKKIVFYIKSGEGSDFDEGVPGFDDGTISSEECSGCELDDECYPLGYRRGRTFCGEDSEFKNQFGDEKSCENNFECKSNLCFSGQCVSQGLMDRFIEWFSRVFGK